MDYTWLILFILIGIVSSILSKRREKGEAARRQKQQGGADAAGRAQERKPAPASPGPPVAPGPFGPVFRPKPLPEPKPAPTATERPEQRQEPSVAPSPKRPIFEEMRADLERKKSAQVPEISAEPEAPRRERKPAAAAERPPTPIPQPVMEGVSVTRRTVSDVAGPALVRRRRSVAGWGLDRAGLRRAFIMSEILGKPVSMRLGEEPWDSF